MNSSWVPNSTANPHGCDSTTDTRKIVLAGSDIGELSFVINQSADPLSDFSNQEVSLARFTEIDDGCP